VRIVVNLLSYLAETNTIFFSSSFSSL